MIVAHLRRFNQIPEWNVRQVLSIRGFFMSATHLHHSDKKLGLGANEGGGKGFEGFEGFEGFKG